MDTSERFPGDLVEHARAFAVLAAEIAKLPLRHREVLTLIDAYESGRALMPTGAYDVHSAP